MLTQTVYRAGSVDYSSDYLGYFFSTSLKEAKRYLQIKNMGQHLFSCQLEIVKLLDLTIPEEEKQIINTLEQLHKGLLFDFNHRGFIEKKYIIREAWRLGYDGIKFIDNKIKLQGDPSRIVSFVIKDPLQIRNVQIIERGQGSLRYLESLKQILSELII